MKKIVIGLLCFLFISTGAVPAFAHHKSEIPDKTLEECLAIINGNPAIVGLVYTGIQNANQEQWMTPVDLAGEIPDQIDVGELRAYLESGTETFFNLGLVGGWEFEYTTPNLELEAFDDPYYKDMFLATETYSVRNITDWSWLQLFEGKNIFLNLRSFTETDYLHLINTKFYAALEEHVYLLQSGYFSRALGLDFQKIWPMTLIRPDRRGESHVLSAYSFGGALPFTVKADNYEEIFFNTSDYSYIDPEGNVQPLEYIYGPMISSIVFLDNGTYLYFEPGFMNLDTITSRYEAAYYSKATSGNIIARYDIIYDEVSGVPYYKLNPNIPVSYDDATGALEEIPSPITSYDELRSHRSFKFGGYRNIYSPLMLALDYGYPSEVWSLSSSYWNVWFQFPAKITVKYVDSNGAPLLPQDELFGNVDTPYATSAKTIPGYLFHHIDGLATGLFDVNDQIITYYYASESTGGGGGGGGGGGEPTPLSQKHVAYVVGYPDDSFRPEGELSRGEAAAMYARLLTDQNIRKSIGKDYPDVGPLSWYYLYIKYLSIYNIISGYPDGTFHPEEFVTRAEFATMASRFDTTPPGGKEPRVFKDVSSGHWAKASIDYLSAKNVVSGDPTGDFRPDENITRAEAVTMLNALLGRKADTQFLSEHSGSAISYTDVDTSYWAYGDIQEASIVHLSHIDQDKETWVEILK